MLSAPKNGKLCNIEVECKFYRHLNSFHKMKKDDYLKKFPDQIKEYDQQVPQQWCKGLTKSDHPSIAKVAMALKNHTNQSHIRKERSDRLKERYKKGDILDSITRSRVAKSGSDDWVKKLQQVTDIERIELLKPFTSAGNKAQQEKRHLLTPEDYNQMYSFAKGVARYHNCDYCERQFIAWFGGKPRPKKRFCNQKCFQDFCFYNPYYCLSNKTIRFYSTKMQTEFCLRSKLELWLAHCFDIEDRISSWCTPPFYIRYNWLGKDRRYYPNFLVNEKYVIEVKSDYIRKIQGEERTVSKLEEAESFCKKSGYQFLYWQFDGSNQTENDILQDERLVLFLERLNE